MSTVLVFAILITIVKQFNMKKANAVSTPMYSIVKLNLANYQVEKALSNERNTNYKAIFGLLMHVALASRSNISFAAAEGC